MQQSATLVPGHGTQDLALARPAGSRTRDRAGVGAFFALSIPLAGGAYVSAPVLGPGVPFEAAKLLVELLGRIVTAKHAKFATMERRVEPRGGRLYVDTG